MYAYPDVEKGWIRSKQRAGSWCTSTKSAEIEVLSYRRSYHVYKDRWSVAVGELSTCPRVPTNAGVRYTVAVIKEGTLLQARIQTSTTGL